MPALAADRVRSERPTARRFQPNSGRHRAPTYRRSSSSTCSPGRAATGTSPPNDYTRQASWCSRSICAVTAIRADRSMRRWISVLLLQDVVAAIAWVEAPAGSRLRSHRTCGSISRREPRHPGGCRRPVSAQRGAAVARDRLPRSQERHGNEEVRRPPGAARRLEERPVCAAVGQGTLRGRSTRTTRDAGRGRTRDDDAARSRTDWSAGW